MKEALTVYHYPKCSTCRRALGWLTERNIAFVAVDLVATPPPVETLTKILALSKLPIARLFNTSGELYREGNYKERLKTLSEKEALAELAAHGKLIKRPILLGPGLALVGFREAEWEEAFAPRK